MTFPATVVRVLIASPSDVIEEREIATATVQHWNDINSLETEIVLLPMKWETHSSPEYRIRPQQAINEQVIDHCDMAIGIFWTRIGSSTGSSLSGTIEEIERVADAGKPVMLYFSKADAPLEKIDIDQLKSLREFELRTRNTALIEYYTNKVDFRDKLYRQLDATTKRIRSSLENEMTPLDENTDIYEDPYSISFEIANPITHETADQDAVIQSTFYPASTFESIPIFGGDQASSQKQAISLSDLLKGAQNLNPNYLKESFAATAISQLLTPIAFKFHNGGFLGFRDVYAEISFESEIDFYITQANPQNSSKPSRILAAKSMLSQPSPLDYLQSITSKPLKNYFFSMNIAALQPKRTLVPQSTIWIGGNESCEIIIRAKIYADILQEPLEIFRKILISAHKEESMDFFDEILRISPHGSQNP